MENQPGICKAQSAMKNRNTRLGCTEKNLMLKRSSWNLSWLSSWNLSWLSSMNHFQHFPNLGVELNDLKRLDVFFYHDLHGKIKWGPSDLYRHRGSCSGWSSECLPPQLFRLRQPLGKVYVSNIKNIQHKKNTSIHAYNKLYNYTIVFLFFLLPSSQVSQNFMISQKYVPSW